MMAQPDNAVDDQTVAYMLAAQTWFEDLKQVAAQLAGLLVLKEAGAAPDHPMLTSASQAYKNAADGLKSARVPAPARRHHDHLLAAAATLDEALLARGDSLGLLEGAYAELRSASRTLPGFQMISFERGCCAA
jgi:hypothetical protein